MEFLWLTGLFAQTAGATRLATSRRWSMASN
jgi:hypothetical protein